MKTHASVLLQTFVAIVVTVIAQSGRAAIVNGDFEDLTGWGGLGSFEPPAGWTLPIGEPSPVSQQTGSNAIGGSGTSALFSGNANGFRIQQAQTFNSPWVFEFDFGAEDAGGDAGRTVDLALTFDEEPEDGNIFMRVVDVGDNGVGDIQFHDAAGAGWTSVAALADSVSFSSDVAVAHSLNHVKLVSHFNQPNPTYDAIVTSSQGEFTALGINLFSFGSLPTLNGGGIANVAFFESQTPGAEWLLDNVSLTAGTSAVPGDFDSDGDVDGADFVVWQTNFPTATGATLDDGDADGDGDVDGADFVVWQTNFPTTPAPGISSVPEPASVSLLIAAGITLVALRRRSL